MSFRQSFHSTCPVHHRIPGPTPTAKRVHLTGNSKTLLTFNMVQTKMELSQVMGVPLPVVMYDHDLVLKHGDDWASPSLRIPKRCHSALRVASIIPNLFSSSDPHPDILSWHSFWRTIWKNQYAGYMYVGAFLTVFLTDTLTVFLAFYLAPILTYFLDLSGIYADILSGSFWHLIWHFSPHVGL